MYVARAEVFAGICGFSTSINAKQESDKIKIIIKSDCKWISKLADEIREVDPSEIFKTICESKIYETASKHIKHLACPIPSAIVKAVEVEAGLALPKNVMIKIEK